MLGQDTASVFLHDLLKELAQKNLLIRLHCKEDAIHECLVCFCLCIISWLADCFSHHIQFCKSIVSLLHESLNEMAQKNLLIGLHWSHCMFCEEDTIERRVIYLLSVQYFVAVFISSHSILLNILVDLGNPIRRVSDVQVVFLDESMGTF